MDETVDAAQLRDALVAACQTGAIGGIDNAGPVAPNNPDEEAVLGLTYNGSDFFLVIQSA